jgi:hypothetical protein
VRPPRSKVILEYKGTPSAPSIRQPIQDFPIGKQRVPQVTSFYLGLGVVYRGVLNRVRFADGGQVVKVYVDSSGLRQGFASQLAKKV